MIVGPSSCRRKVNRVTTPKLPPPPRSAQKRSASRLRSVVPIWPRPQ